MKKVSSKRDVREMRSEEVQFLGGNDPAEIKSPRLRTQRKCVTQHKNLILSEA